MKTRTLWLAPLVFLAPCASGTLTTQEAIQSQLDQAVLVADIDVESLENFSDPVYQVRSVANATVVRVYRRIDDGQPIPSQSDTIKLEVRGGELGDTGVTYSDIPRPYVGRRYRAYLARRHDDTFSTVGLHYGLVPLVAARSSSRNRTDGSNGSGSGAFLFWDHAYFPIPYFINLPSFTNLQGFVSAVDESFRPWRDPGNTLVEFLPMGCTTAASNKNDGINTISFITENWPYDPSAIAITRNFYVSGGTAREGLILDTDIMINAAGFSFSANGAPGKHDIQNILTHEVGHFIGLGHEVITVDSDATMFALASLGETKKRDLAQSDIQGLLGAYGGVGLKIPRLSTELACSLERLPLSCAAAHRGKTNAPNKLWILAYLVAVFGLGRLLKWQLPNSDQKTTSAS